MLSKLSAVALMVTLAAACTKSPTDPSDAAGTRVHGQTVSAVDGAAAPNLSVRVGLSNATSDANGFFEIDLGNTGLSRATINGNGIVERETRLMPGGDLTRVTLIPRSFDLDAFDQMFRSLNGQLSRWTSRPALVVLAAVMDYRGTGDTYEATGEQLTEEEIAEMVAHHTEGLAVLTGGTYTSFASVQIERPAAGTRVSPFRSGMIVVGRYKGVENFARTIGYGQWSAMPNGSVAGGATFLDREFDRGDSRRRLLRIHELGHALGYQHVETRTSIMNPSIGADVTSFDRSGAIIAFQRPVGNRAPDVDPESGQFSAVTGEARWSAPTICR
jgi:hypothetical protein